MNEKEHAKMEDAVQNFAKKESIDVVIHRAPENPEKKKEWARRMANLQILMWVNDGAKCAYCGHIYRSVEDFRARNPRSGYFEKNDPEWFDKMFVCDQCWSDYDKLHNSHAKSCG